MESDEAWTTGHRAAARYMYVAGAGLIVAGVASVFLTEAALAIVALAVSYTHLTLPTILLV